MSYLTSRFESIVTRLERRHHFPWTASAGCCTVEIQNAGLATYDWQRLGVDDLATDPTQANLLLIAGWITKSRADEIRTIYGLMKRPTWVIALGSCALSGSPYATPDEMNENKVI